MSVHFYHKCPTFLTLTDCQLHCCDWKLLKTFWDIKWGNYKNWTKYWSTYLLLLFTLSTRSQKIDNRTFIIELLLQARGSLLVFWLGQTTFYTAWLTNERCHRDGVQAFKGLTTIREHANKNTPLSSSPVRSTVYVWDEANWPSAPSSWRKRCTAELLILLDSVLSSRRWQWEVYWLLNCV